METCQTKQYDTSGSPQGSVLGNILCVLYTHELNNSVPSPVQLFADDSFIYIKITSEPDREILIKLQTWSDKCQMEINRSKRVYLPLTHQTKLRHHSHSLFGVQLSIVFSHQHLGIKLHSKLSWRNNITDIVSKSSTFLAMI